MATGKAKKKDKLRHAEYYDFQAIQDKLYADSNKGKVFKHLVEIIALTRKHTAGIPQHQEESREYDARHRWKNNHRIISTL